MQQGQENFQGTSFKKVINNGENIEILNSKNILEKSINFSNVIPSILYNRIQQ